MSFTDKQRIDQIVCKWTLRHGLKIERAALDDLVNRFAHSHKRSKGCAVAEARRALDEELKQLREEVQIARERLGPAGYKILQDLKRLREAIALTEARRSDLWLALELIRFSGTDEGPKGYAQANADNFDIAMQALQDQPRPKILAVLEAAIKVKAEYDAVPLSVRRYVGKNEDALFAAVAAMKEES